MSRAAMQPQTRYVDGGDGSIAYQVVGEGPLDLLFVPGLVSHLDLQWSDPCLSRVLRRLAAFARLIIFDQRGVGLSDPVQAVPTVEQRRDDISAVLDAAGSKRAALVAVCNGGPPAMLLAATHPERVESLVICSSFARGRPDSSHPGALSAADYQRAVEALEHWGEGLSLRLNMPSVAGGALHQRLYAAFERAALSPGMARAAITSTLDIDVTAVLPTIRAPTLVLHCTDDYVSIDAGRYIADRIPDARFIELAGADHAPLAGRSSGELVKLIEEFLTGSSQAVDPDRIVATVLFTDIVRSTEHALAFGDRRWAYLLERHDEVVRMTIERFGGREIKALGDGFLAAFDGAECAVRAALDVIQQVQGLGLQARAGLHAGECLIHGMDLSGATVHVGARIAAHARPSEVLVSSAVKELVAGSGLQVAGRGDARLKGFPGRWPLYAAQSDGERPKAWTAAGESRKEVRLGDRLVVNLASRAPTVARTVANLASKQRSTH